MNTTTSIPDHNCPPLKCFYGFTGPEIMTLCDNNDIEMMIMTKDFQYAFPFPYDDDYEDSEAYMEYLKHSLLPEVLKVIADRTGLGGSFYVVLKNHDQVLHFGQSQTK